MDARDTRARLMTLLRGVAELSGHGGYAERGPVYEWIHQQGWYGAHESTRLRQDLTRLMERFVSAQHRCVSNVFVYTILL